jgi:outer membrane protein assembly factor BamB
MEVGEGEERGYPMVIEDDVVMVAGTGITAHDQETGENSWFCTVETSATAVTTDGKQIYVVPQKREDVHKELAVHTIDLGSGDLQPPVAGIKDLNANMYSTQLLCAADGVVYLAGASGTRASLEKSYLLAVDVRTGREVWRQTIVNPEGDTTYVQSATVRNGLLVTFEPGAGDSYSLIVRDGRTGATRWKRTFQYSPGSGADGRPCVDDDHVYVGGDALVAHRLSDGGKAWAVVAGKYNALGSMAVRNGVVYARNFQGVVAVGAADGKVRWFEQGTNATVDSTPNALIVGERFVYSKVALGLSAVDLKTHRRSWVYQTDVYQFGAQERDGRLFAVGEDFLIALPLK